MSAINITGAMSPQDITRSIIRQKAWQLYEKSDNIFSQAYCFICIPNDAASLAFTDAYEQLSQSKYFRHETKMYAKRTRKLVEAYDRHIYNHMKKTGKEMFFMEICDNYNEHIRKHVFLLRMAIKQKLDLDREPKSELVSYLLTAFNLIQMAVMQWECFWTTVDNSCGYDLKRNFRGGNFCDIFEAWRKTLIFLPLEVNSRILESKDVQTGICSLLQKLIDPDILKDAIMKADEKIRLKD